MRKLLGYIPLDPGEDFNTTAKETDVVKIEQQWFKLVEVWIPETTLVTTPTNCGHLVTEKKDEFKGNHDFPGGLYELRKDKD